MHAIKSLTIAIVITLVFGAIAQIRSGSALDALIMNDIQFLSTKIQSMYNEVRPRILIHHEDEPYIYIALADIDDDQLPEFFYGYQTVTAYQMKVWFRAYSLNRHSMIDCEHTMTWNTYLSEDEACCFYVGAIDGINDINFIEGYYINDRKEPVFVTQAHVGTVLHAQTNYCLIRYKDSIMRVEEESGIIGASFREPLIPIKQVWAKISLDSVEDEILALLRDYQQLV